MKTLDADNAHWERVSAKVSYVAFGLAAVCICTLSLAESLDPLSEFRFILKSVLSMLGALWVLDRLVRPWQPQLLRWGAKHRMNRAVIGIGYALVFFPLLRFVVFEHGSLRELLWLVLVCGLGTALTDFKDRRDTADRKQP